MHARAWRLWRPLAIGAAAAAATAALLVFILAPTPGVAPSKPVPIAQMMDDPEPALLDELALVDAYAGGGFDAFSDTGPDTGSLAGPGGGALASSGGTMAGIAIE